MKQSVFICIDLKSFYASVECVERGLDPLSAKLVVADETRTDKTICLAVSPALKAYGIGGRARLFEVKQRLREVKQETGEDVSFIIAPPRMAIYEEISAAIYSVYLRHISPDDIHVYSIDEVFIDAGAYLDLYNVTAHGLALDLIREVLSETGITATAGIGPNMYLAKIAMDIVAKHTKADKDGVRIAELDEMSYRRKLWEHTPLTDFWHIGHGISERLARAGMFTMGDVARMSIANEDTLYSMFGINAEILIDHAWGIEPTRMTDIKNYRASSNSLSEGQVLPEPYEYADAKIIIREMSEQLVSSITAKRLMTDGIVISVVYDRKSVDDGIYAGELSVDCYGRVIPKSAHGSARFEEYTSSESRIVAAAVRIFDEITDRALYIRRLNVALIRLEPCENVLRQINMFADTAAEERELNLQRTVVELRKKFNKNIVLKGHDLTEKARTIERNSQIGGHRA